MLYLALSQKSSMVFPNFLVTLFVWVFVLGTDSDRDPNPGWTTFNSVFAMPSDRFPNQDLVLPWMCLLMPSWETRHQYWPFPVQDINFASVRLHLLWFRPWTVWPPKLQLNWLNSLRLLRWISGHSHLTDMARCGFINRYMHMYTHFSPYLNSYENPGEKCSV